MSNLYPAHFEEVFDVFEDCRNREVSTPDGFVVTFRDIPEANTQGDTFLEAVEMAQNALKTAMEFYDERGEPRPEPSIVLQGDVMILLK